MADDALDDRVPGGSRRSGPLRPVATDRARKQQCITELMAAVLIWLPPGVQDDFDVWHVEIGLQSYIRPLMQEDKPAGPDGIRRKRPHLYCVTPVLGLCTRNTPGFRQ